MTSPSDPTNQTVFATLPATQAQVVARLAPVFAAAGEALHLVGGVVRDALLADRPAPAAPAAPTAPTDLDFATSALPETTERLGIEAGAVSSYLVGQQYGTVGLVFETEPDRTLVEITTYRREHYPDASRKPAVVLGGTLEDDLARRDFTVNAMAADATSGELVDPFGGQADLHLAVIRAVGDPDERFHEDPLRLLRAARFVAQLGFRFDPPTEAAMARNAGSLGRISQERILAELTRLLVGPYADHGLGALAETGLLAVALPELVPLSRMGGEPDPRLHREKDLWAHTRQVVVQAPARPAVRWAALLHDAAKPHTRGIDVGGEVHFFGHEAAGAALARKLLRRLKADRATEATVARLVDLHGRPESYEPDWTDSAVRRLALDAGDDLPDLLDLAAADVTSGREEKRQLAAARVDALRRHLARLEAERALAEYRSPLDGDALMALFDRPPGRWIAVVKDHLRELVLDGVLAPDDTDRAAAIAADLLASLDADADAGAGAG